MLKLFFDSGRRRILTKFFVGSVAPTQKGPSFRLVTEVVGLLKFTKQLLHRLPVRGRLGGRDPDSKTPYFKLVRLELLRVAGRHELGRSRQQSSQRIGVVFQDLPFFKIIRDHNVPATNQRTVGGQNRPGDDRFGSSIKRSLGEMSFRLGLRLQQTKQRPRDFDPRLSGLAI